LYKSFIIKKDNPFTMENENKQKKTYSKPKVTEYGPVEVITGTDGSGPLG
jgi:hypothetical protein